MREQPISWRKAGWGLFLVLALLATAWLRPQEKVDESRDPAPEEQRKLLKAKEPAQRRTAAKALGIYGRGDFTPDLLPLLKDTDSEVRLTAALALAKIGPLAQAAALDLVKLTKDGDGQVRAAAFTALGSLNVPAETALEAYRQGLTDGSPVVRQAALIACGSLGPQAKTLLPRIQELLKDKQREVQVAACFALSRLEQHGLPAIGDLKDLMTKNDPELRLEAAVSLWVLTRDPAYLKEIEQATSKGRDQRLREIAFERLHSAIRTLVASNLPDALNRLRSAETPSALRRAILDAMAELPSVQLNAVLPDIVDRLDDGVLREQASKLLLRIGRPAVPVLIRKLKAPDRIVRRESANLLGQMGAAAQEAIPALIEALADKEPMVQSGAARALGQFGKEAKAALPALKELENAKDRPLSFQAKTAVASIEGRAPPTPTSPVRPTRTKPGA